MSDCPASPSQMTSEPPETGAWVCSLRSSPWQLERLSCGIDIGCHGYQSVLLVTQPESRGRRFRYFLKYLYAFFGYASVHNFVSFTPKGVHCICALFAEFSNFICASFSWASFVHQIIVIIIINYDNLTVKHHGLYGNRTVVTTVQITVPDFF